MTAHAPRTRPRSRPLLALTEREIAVLARLARFRVATSDQLYRGLYPTGYGAKRLRRLFDGGLCRVLIGRSQEHSFYELTRLGRDVLAEQLPGLALPPLRSAPLNLATLPHLQLLVDAGLYAEALGQWRGSPLVRWSSTDERLPLADLRLRPDAIADFATPNGSVLILIESDTGSEGQGVIAGKLARYGDLAGRGLADAVWFAVPGAGRAATVTALAVEAGLGSWARVLTREHLVARPVRELPERGAGAVGPSVLYSAPHTEESRAVSSSSAAAGGSSPSTR